METSLIQTKMNLELEGKRALVTGSTAGIGYAIAEALAREGADVIVNGRTEERGEQAIRAIRTAYAQAQGGRSRRRSWERRRSPCRRRTAPRCRHSRQQPGHFRA